MAVEVIYRTVFTLETKIKFEFDVSAPWWRRDLARLPESQQTFGATQDLVLGALVPKMREVRSPLDARKSLGAT
jgi:hypothetical protein